jgi:Tfp pilus assembly protein PilF
MKTTTSLAIAAAAALAACLTLSSKSAAEPISGADSLADPWQTATRTEDVAGAMAKFKAQDYAGALKLWKEIVKRNADLGPAQVLMGQLYLQAGMVEEGRKALEQAIVDVPDDPEAYMLMALVAMHDHDVAKAESLYRKAGGLLTTFDKSAKRKALLQPQVYGGLASVADARKDWPASQKAIEEWLKLDPKNATAMQRLAFSLFQQKNVDGALEQLRAAAKADATLATPEVLLARFYQWSSDRENVAKWMAAALVAAPRDVKTRLAVGQWAVESGQIEEARKQAMAAVQIDQKSLEAMSFRGMVALLEKDYVSADSYLELALKKAPRDFSIGNNLALALIEQNDEAKKVRALEIAEANARKYPKLATAVSTYGWALYKQGRLEDAEKALRTAVSLGPASVDTAYYTARVLSERNQRAEARSVLETAMKNAKPAMFRQEAEELLAQLKK